MSRLMVPRILATGSVLSAATSVRVAAGCAGLVAGRAPRLLGLALSGAVGTRAQWAFRDEILALARESAELSWREMRRGVDALDVSTRNGQAGGPVARPYRVKP
jgi:hypothetical protein